MRETDDGASGPFGFQTDPAFRGRDDARERDGADGS